MTAEQQQTLTALAQRGLRLADALILSGDIYIPYGDAVIRVDPDGVEHPTPEMPIRGATIAQSQASDRALAKTLRRMSRRRA
jgi:hypothetical protein